ncbi:hypothetical protein EAO70_22530 [Streptomyces sp. adm13(2018)]|nr:hypothetical protein EAO70_22530 [Streptomyces sp. adm13(2018)]
MPRRPGRGRPPRRGHGIRGPLTAFAGGGVAAAGRGPLTPAPFAAAPFALAVAASTPLIN